MSNEKILHALGLHMHQPPGNMKLLIEANPWEAQQIIHCYDRATRYAHKYINDASLHVGFSGILLEQLRDPAIVDAYRHYMDIPAMLNSYREAGNIELIGMGYYHPIFPLIPMDDWEEQLIAGRQIMEDTFGRAPRGFWPPEMAFTMEMIPALVKAGYEYVVVDSVHVQPADGVHDIYRPYKATHNGATITVIPRDRDISNAQESGLDPTWFSNEVQHKVRTSPHPEQTRLVTTWSDGENGGWFRNMDDAHGFFGHFFAPYIEHGKNGEFAVHTVAISEFLRQHPPVTETEVKTGAWNVGNTSGYDFAQWNGSENQKKALERIYRASGRYAELAKTIKSGKPADTLKQARRVILEGETSCFLFWGDDWLPRLHEYADRAEQLMAEAEKPEPPEKPKAASSRSKAATGQRKAGAEAAGTGETASPETTKSEDAGSTETPKTGQTASAASSSTGKSRNTRKTSSPGRSRSSATASASSQAESGETAGTDSAQAEAGEKSAKSGKEEKAGASAGKSASGKTTRSRSSASKKSTASTAKSAETNKAGDSTNGDGETEEKSGKTPTTRRRSSGSRSTKK